MVSISACHAEDPGSIPGRGVFAQCGVHLAKSASSMRAPHIYMDPWEDRMFIVMRASMRIDINSAIV